MKQLIYNFLEDSVGPGVRVSGSKDFYYVYSGNNTHIFSFKMRDDWGLVKLYRYEPLCRTVNALFSVTEDEAAKFISNWFGEKYGMNKVVDIKKFV